ncbi:MAG: SWIM zinc finger family protein, partial [Proteobacteria bacterium]|nr:SWIM zinc finger family protein [Pseudomonadota bacterium]
MARKLSGDYDYDYGYFPPSRPRAAAGGIVAASQRGGFGKSWWAKRWIAVLEGFRIGARLGRGRSYARSGQVLDIDVEKGRVTAWVQGSRAKPYGVTIQVKPLTRAAWEKVGAVLCRQALFAAKLLAGEMPQDIETAFAEARVSLFPERAGDLATDCSCPDWSNPCKHIAAVYYLLGEEFDRDPFLIFRLRGLERAELTALVGGAGGASPEEPATESAGGAGSGPAAPEP